MSDWMLVLMGTVSGAHFAWALRNYLLGRATLRWPRTEGTIVDLWFDVQEKNDGDGDMYVSTTARLVYHYVVDGRHYRSRHFTYLPHRDLGEREAYGLLAHLRRGQTVEVRYDPRRPRRAVVLPGIGKGNRWAVAGSGGLLSLSMIIAMYRYWWS